jgi:hypothetical protein
MATTHGRRWEPHRIRSGTGAKHVFSCTCSEPECGWTGTFESYQNLPDEVVSKKFQHFGWLLGRTNAHNICKRCIEKRAGVQPKNELANVFRVVENGVVVRTSQELRAKAANEIIEDISRHSPKQSPESESPKPASGMGLNLEQTLDLIQALKGINENMGLIASELGNVRAALELQAEQTYDMVKKSSNQTKALTMIGPLIARTTEAVRSGFATQQQTLNNLVTGQRETLAVLRAAPPLVPTERRDEPKQAQQMPSDEATPARLPQRSNIPMLKAALQGPKNPAVSIYSNLAKTGRQAGRKWYTTIRVSRELWDAANLDNQDRVVVTQDGDLIRLSKPINGHDGIKVKKLSDMVAIIQVSHLGDINTKDLCASVENGSLTFHRAQ